MDKTKINSIIKKNFSNITFKPINSDNGNNGCWVNSALYLISSNPYIFFQYLLLDNSRLSTSQKNIYNDIYYNNIIYNYKYVKSEGNKTSNILYDENIFTNLFVKYVKHKLIALPNSWGEIWDAINVIDNLFNIITKTHHYTNNLCYLSANQFVLNNQNDFNNIINVNNKKLVGFVIGERCNKYDLNRYHNIIAYHWISFIKCNLDDDDKWYKFDANAISNKVDIVKKNTIYDCYIKGYKKNGYGIYIDLNKLNIIMQNPKNRDNFSLFLELIKTTSYNSIEYDNIKKNLHDISNNIDKTFIKEKKESFIKNKNDINVNLLTIKEIEHMLPNNVNLFDKNIIDKRAYLLKYMQN